MALRWWKDWRQSERCSLRLSPQQVGLPPQQAGLLLHQARFSVPLTEFSPQYGTCSQNVLQPQVTHPTKKKLNSLNPAIKKQHKMPFFKTLNNAKTIWDSRSKPSGILLGHINIRSIVNKTEQMEHLLSDSNIDIVGVSESWLTHSSSTAAISIPGYNVFRKDRETGRGGGILIYVRDKFKCELIRWPKEVNVECIGLNISLSSAMYFTVICVYRPPSAKDVFYDHLKTILNHCSSKKEITLLGDFNINWDIKSDRKKIKQLTDKYNLTQIIKGPTRITNTSHTTIDLIFTNKPERISKTFNLLSGLSDHNFILYLRKIKRTHLMASTRGQQYYFIPKSQQQFLNEEIQNVDWSNILENNDIEASSDSFIKKLNDIVTHFTKKGNSKQRKNDLPWLNNEIIKLMKSRDNALKQSLRTRTASDRHIFTSLRNKVLRMTRKLKAEFYIETIKGANGNGKLIWKNLNQLLSRDKSNYLSDLQLQVNDKLTNNLDIIVNYLNRFFISSVEELTKHFNCSQNPHNPVDASKPMFSIEEISVLEVIQIISSLKSSKARDTFGLTSDFLKTHKEALADPIAHLVNLCSVLSMWTFLCLE